jgi:hypothetical protein
LAHPPAVVTCTEDDDDDVEQYYEHFAELGVAAGVGGVGGVGSGSVGAAAASLGFGVVSAASTTSTTTLDEDFGLEDYGASSSSNNGNNGNSSNSDPIPATTLRRGEVAVAVPLTSALVVTDEPLEGPSAVGDRQQAQWQIEHGALPPALADFLQQAGARWDVRMAAWVLWLAGGAAERAAAGTSPSSSSSTCSPLWAHYLRLMPTPHELCPLLMYGRSDLDDEGDNENNSSAATTAARLLCPSNTPTSWLQLPSLMAEAESQREWSEYMHDAYFAPINGRGTTTTRVVSAAAAAGAAARQLRALRNGQGLSPSRAASAWAQALVRSRSFSDDVGGEGLTLMVPFADLANHTPAGGSATFHVSRDGRAFHLRALRSSPARSELTISYGERTSNDHLLRDYGFVVPANPYDRLDFGAIVGGGSGVVLPGVGGGGNGGTTTSTKTLDPSWTLNAASLLEYAGFGGDPNNEPDSVKPLPATVAAATASTANPTTTDALAKRQKLVRRRCVLLSLPTRNTSPHSGAPGAGGGGPASALFSWASSAAAPPPPLPLRKRDAPAERAVAARLLAAVDARLASLPTSAQTDEELLREGRADVEGDGSLGGRNRGGATRPLTPREATAVRARLEHKRLLLEARAMLRGYDAWVSQML